MMFDVLWIFEDVFGSNDSYYMLSHIVIPGGSYLAMHENMSVLALM